jgi:hypothetical protein
MKRQLANRSSAPLFAIKQTGDDDTLDAQIRAQEQELENAKQHKATEELNSSKPIWSAQNAMTVSSAVLVYSLIVLALATYLIRLGKSSSSVLRIFGTILIISSSIFLIVAGYTSQQIAPAMGLLGTLAGYLLGKESANIDPD